MKLPVHFIDEDIGGLSSSLQGLRVTAGIIVRAPVICKEASAVQSLQYQLTKSYKHIINSIHCTITSIILSYTVNTIQEETQRSLVSHEYNAALLRIKTKQKSFTDVLLKTSFNAPEFKSYNIFDNLHHSTSEKSIKHPGSPFCLIRSSSENSF